MEAAIKASLEETTHKTQVSSQSDSDSDSDGSLETFTDSEDEVPIETMVKVTKSKGKSQEKSNGKQTKGSILESDSAISITDYTNSSSHCSSAESSIGADTVINTTEKCSGNTQESKTVQVPGTAMEGVPETKIAEPESEDWKDYLGHSEGKVNIYILNRTFIKKRKVELKKVFV